MSAAQVDSSSFEKNLRDHWALLLQPSFSCFTNCRTLIQRNSVLLLFDVVFQFHNFSITSSCIFSERTALTSIFFSFIVKI